MPSRKGRPTRKANRKQRAGAKALTIPELKQAFDALDQGVIALLREKGSEKEQVKAFQTLWRNIFHKSVTAESAVAYLAVKRSARMNSTRRNKGRSQAGGAAPLAGAPLDYMTRPGIDGVHVSVPSYVSQGLTFYNTINQDSLVKECGITDITPKVPISIGSNEVMKGGGSPPSLMDTVRTYWNGRAIGPSSDPSDSKLSV